MVHQVVDAIAAVGKPTAVGHLVAFGHHIAVHVGDVGHACEHACAVGVAQAPFHVVFRGIVFGVYRMDR